ncbi:hypothetical protein Ancab_034753, partial [Ancistrocladus abbreviatus]
QCSALYTIGNGMRQGEEDSEGIPTIYQGMLLARNLSNLCRCSMLKTGVCRRKDKADEAKLHGSEGRCELQGVLEVASREEDRAWLKESYIGVVHPFVDLASIQNQLFSSNNFRCEIRSLGGRKVLISSIEEEGVERLLVEDDIRASQELGEYISIDSRTQTRSSLLFARILVHTTKLERNDERMNIRVDGALFQIKVNEEMVNSEDLLYSKAAALDGCKKTYLTLSLVVPSSPSHVEESIFNDQKESSTKPFPGMDGGITTKSAEQESSGLREERELTGPSNVGSSATEQECPIYQEPEGLLQEGSPSNLPAPQRPGQQPLILIEQSQSIRHGEAKGVDIIQLSAPGKDPVKLKDKSHRRSKKKTLEDILVLGSQKTRLLMQRSMKKQVKARLNNNKKKPANTEERCGESGKTINDSKILNKNRILCAMNEQ